MELRPSLLPPAVETALVPQLAALVEEIDLLREGEAATQIRTFNRAVGSNLKYNDFREYFAAQSAEDFAFEQLVEHAVAPTPDVSSDELAELVRRAKDSQSEAEKTAYRALLRVNGAHRAIGWIYWPPDWDPDSRTWGNGRTISEYNPSPQEIVNRLSTSPISG